MKKLPAYKEAGAKCTDIMIILENGKIGKKNNRGKVKFWLRIVTVHGQALLEPKVP